MATLYAVAGATQRSPALLVATGVAAMAGRSSRTRGAAAPRTRLREHGSGDTAPGTRLRGHGVAHGVDDPLLGFLERTQRRAVFVGERRRDAAAGGAQFTLDLPR